MEKEAITSEHLCRTSGNDCFCTKKYRKKPYSVLLFAVQLPFKATSNTFHCVLENFSEKSSLCFLLFMYSLPSNPYRCKRFVYSINFTEDKENSMNYRSSHSEVFLGKGVPKICSKFTGEHSCRSVKSHISMDVLL